MKRVAGTSILSYQELKETLGERQRSVLDLIERFPCRTDRELAKIAGVADPNMIRPRRTELTRRGLVRESGRRRCDVSGKLAATWRVVYEHEQLDLFGRETTIEEEYPS